MNNAIHSIPIPSNSSQGLWIYPEIAMNENLNHSEMFLLSLIHSFNLSEHGCYATNDYLAKKLRLCDRQIRRMLMKFRKLKLIEDVYMNDQRYLRTNIFQNQPQDIDNQQPDVNFQGGGHKCPGGEDINVHKIDIMYLYKENDEARAYVNNRANNSFQNQSNITYIIKHFFEKLARFNLKQSDVEALAKIGKPIEQVERILEQAFDSSNERTCPIAAAIHALKNEYEISKKSLSFKDQVLNDFKHGQFYNDSECFIDNQNIAFQRGITHRQVKLNAFDFKQKFLDILQTFQIKYKE